MKPNYISQISKDILAIHNLFCQKEYSIGLKDKIRYLRYKPDEISNEEWLELLGTDVSNIDHLLYTEKLGEEFITNCLKVNKKLFNNSDIKLLLYACISHDWGEAYLIDKMFDLKNEYDLLKEFNALDFILNDILLNNKFITDIEILSLKDIIKDSTSRMGLAFNAIEREGYLRTAIRSWEAADKVTNKKLKKHLRWLTSNVFGNQIPTLINYSFIYPATNKFLIENNSIISEIFENIPISIFNFYITKAEKPYEFNTQLKKFLSSNLEWNNFIMKNFTDNKNEILKTNRKIIQILSNFTNKYSFFF